MPKKTAPVANPEPKVVVSVKMSPALKLRLDQFCTRTMPKLKIQNVVAEAVEDFLKARKG